jgi:hypothetical protein
MSAAKMSAGAIVLGAGWSLSLGNLQPVEERKLAWGALSMWLIVPWGSWIDRHREVPETV